MKPDSEKKTQVGSPVVTELPASSQESSRDATEDASTVAVDAGDVTVRKRMKPSKSWTAHQVFYVFGLHGIGAMCLSAGVNFALAYPMYTTQPSSHAAIKLFALPNTLAGDAAVTIIVQCILTWFVELGLLQFDMRNRAAQPIGFVARPSKPILRWLFYLPPSSSSSTQENGQMGDRLSPRTISLRAILPEALRGFLLAIAGFLILWPIGVGALTSFGQKDEGSLDYTYDDRYVPQGFKAVLGGLLGLFTTPLMALFWLIRAGWEAEGVEDLVQETEVSV